MIWADWWENFFLAIQDNIFISVHQKCQAQSTWFASVQMSPEERAQTILERAGEVLAKVDESHIFSVNECREFPIFENSEIVSGPVLGKGGFSIVSEISEFHVTGVENYTNAKEKNNPPTESAADNDDIPVCLEFDNRRNLLTRDDSQDKTSSNLHYDVESARDFMSKHVRRYGAARYAIKKLREDLEVVDRARGALDLAIEIKFLSAIWHPNIGKSLFLRGRVYM